MSPVRIPRPVAPWKAGIVVVRPQLLGTSERKNGFPASTPWVFWTDSSGFVKHFRSFGPPLPEQRKYAYHIRSYRIIYYIISYHIISYHIIYHISYIVYHICILYHTFSYHKKSLLSCVFFRFTVRTVSRTTSDFARRMGRSSARNSCHHYSTRQKRIAHHFDF